MSKRAVIMSCEMLREFMTKGKVFERVECVEGLPEDAAICSISPSPFRPVFIMVVNSDNWDSEPSEHSAECSAHGRVPIQEVKYRSTPRKPA